MFEFPAQHLSKDRSSSKNQGIHELNAAHSQVSVVPSSLPATVLMNFRLVSPMDIKAKKGRGSYPQEVWLSHRSTIKQLYLEEGRTLKDVMQIMQQRHNFKATEKMYKTKFVQWGFEKNNTKPRVSRMLLVKFQRDISGKSSRFSRHDKEIDIQKYLRRKEVSEYDIIDFKAEKELSRAVRCYTPPSTPGPSEYLKSPDIIRYQELLLRHARNVFLHARPVNGVAGHPKDSVNYACGLRTDSTFSLLLGEKGSPLGELTDTAILLLHSVFRKLNSLLERNRHNHVTTHMLFVMYKASQPGIALSTWKFVSAYWSQRNRHDPTFHLFEFLYGVLVKEGLSGLNLLLENSCLQIVEEGEKVFGRGSYWTYQAWSLLRDRFGAHAIPRYNAQLESIVKNEANKYSQHNLSRASIELMVSRCNLLRKIDPISDAALTGWQQAQRAVTGSRELSGRHRDQLLKKCAYNLYRIHLRHGWDDDPRYNIRLQLAAHYLEENIVYHKRVMNEVDNDVIAKLIDLEELYMATGWSERAADARHRRKQCEAATLTRLQQEGVL